MEDFLDNIYEDSSQIIKGDEGLNLLVEALLNNGFKENDIHLPPKEAGKIHKSDAIYHQDLMIAGEPVDVKWYNSLSKHNCIWPEFMKSRRDNGESCWRVIGRGIWEENYTPKYLFWGDYNLKRFFIIPVQRLKEYITSEANKLEEGNLRVHSHYSNDKRGTTYVEDYEISKAEIEANNLISKEIDLKSGLIKKFNGFDF